jgi:hypothetical protein
MSTQFRNPNANTFLFSDEYLAGLRSEDEKTLKHFDRHFRRLVRLKLFNRFREKPQDELVREIMAAVKARIAQGEPRNANDLPSLVLRVCAVLEKAKAPKRVDKSHEQVRGRKTTCE